MNFPDLSLLATTDVVLLLLCVLSVCAFEFINGFHDTANAVATVIYTHSMKPLPAVVMSGILNFLGLYASTNMSMKVASGIIKLLPLANMATIGAGESIELILAVLLAAIIWNLGTWYFGIPCSSSHTLIGSLLGAGLVFFWIHGGDGVNWHKAQEIGLSLLLSPAFGFFAAFALIYIMSYFIKSRVLFDEHKYGSTPPTWVRGLLIATSAGVSFFHGMNDGQKGVGLLMIVLFCFLPAQYALDPSHLVVPTWGIILVALSLGIGTMIGWKNIVVTVGEKIGKSRLTYAQGAVAQLVAASTIGLSSGLGLPVSTTHVLSSGIAGSMAAEAGVRNLQGGTIRNILIAWLLTLPVTMILAGGLYALFRLV